MINETEYARVVSDVTLYKVPFSKEDNFYFGNLEAVLGKCNPIAFHGLPPIAVEMRKTIRLPLEGSYQSDIPTIYNYAKIEHYDSDTSVQSASYWFIAAMRWSGVNVLVLDLELDTINTLIPSEDLSTLLDKTTMIEREHETRFTYSKQSDGSYNAVARVDNVDEGFKPLLFQKQNDIVYDTRLNISDREITWALDYCSVAIKPVVGGTPVLTRCLAVHPSKTLKGRVSESADPSNIDEISSLNLNFGSDSEGNAFHKIIELPYCPFNLKNASGAYLISIVPAPVNAIANQGTTESKWLVKTDYDGKLFFADYNDTTRNARALEVDGIASVTIDETLTSIPASLVSLTTPRMLKDSKLLNSAFHGVRFVYDSFSWTLALERCELSDVAKVSVDMVVSLAMASTFGFRFNLANGSQTETNDYYNVLVVRRNNEITLITDAYLDYIQTGYNYDQKSKNIGDVQRWASLAVNVSGSAIGGVALAGASGGLSLVTSATSAVGSTINAIASQAQAENDLERKLAEASSKGYNVAGSDDLGLLDALETNKLRVIRYDCSSVVSTMLDNLFYLYGYKRGYQGVPDATSREWFNFVQCNPKWSRYRPVGPRACYDALAMRFREGVTFLHYHASMATAKDADLIAGHNIARTRENWEKGVINNADND